MDIRKGRSIAAVCAVALCGMVLGHDAAANPAQDAMQPASAMSLVVFEGVPGSGALLRGDYELGRQQSLDAYEDGSGRHGAELTNNLCVAHVKLGDLAAASEHCQRAMETRVRGGSGMLESHHYRAVALVNRGVLHSVQGEMAAAGADFAEAGRSFPQLGVARSNLLRLGEAGEPPNATQ